MKQIVSAKNILAVALAVLMLVSVAVSGKNLLGEGSPVPEVSQEVITPEAGETGANAGTTQEPGTNEAGETLTQEPGTKGQQSNGGGSQQPTAAQIDPLDVPSGNAAILARYTLLLDQAKSKVKFFRKMDYQTLPKETINFDVNRMNTVLGMAESLMTSKDKAAKASDSVNGLSNRLSLPMQNHSTKGCLLKDTGFIKSASVRVKNNGNHTMTIVLKNEKNSEPTPPNSNNPPSKIGSMFYVISKEDLWNDYLSAISAFIGDDFAYDLTFYDCTATIEYNPKTHQIVSLDHKINVLINASGTIGLGIGFASGTAVMINEVNWWDFRY